MVLHGKVTAALHQLAPTHEACCTVHLRFRCQLHAVSEHCQAPAV
jgi:hypothetical protein